VKSKAKGELEADVLHVFPLEPSEYCLANTVLPLRVIVGAVAVESIMYTCTACEVH
jgi:hypothetical protein